ncbi:MAG: glycosyltransferase family 4 protein [Daejeonella sp.]
MPELYTYIFFVFLLFITELFYFKLAEHFNIIDHPNDRSSHTTLTLRGGGIIFPIAILLYSAYFGFQYPYFICGLFLISFISFWDDLHTISNKIRLFLHLVSVSLLFVELGILNYPVWIICLSYILIIGTINAYNFMDGINGITGLYSLTAFITLYFLNNSLHFISNDLVIIIILALLVFLFFNFRTKAKCFAGDVGSVSISFILLFAIGLLMIRTGQLLYILFLAVYGVDTVLTILKRLLNKENIFEAHRSHAYQILSNERKKPQLMVSFAYAFLQLLINALIIYILKFDSNIWGQLLFAFGLLFLLSFFYISIHILSSQTNKKIHA